MNIITVTEPVYRPREGAGPAGAAGAENDPPAARPSETAPPPAPSRLLILIPMAAALIAAFAATLSAIGLVAASRTVAEAHAAIDEFRAGRPAALPVPVATATGMEDTQPRAATAAQVREVVETLRADIVRYQQARDRSAPTGDSVREGQTEIARRLGAIEVRLGRIEQGLSPSR